MDESNIDLIIPRLVRVSEKLNESLPITVVPGTELTHVPPGQISLLVKEARKLGAKIVIVHGETIVEPVEKGTNAAAIEAGADIISHPGLIEDEDLFMAKDKGVHLEITSRKGHSLSNGYIAKKAMELGVSLVLNTDGHSPSDLITRKFAEEILLSAGIERNRIEEVFFNSEKLVKKAMKS
jgi:histidinol phosphatase-like PHP family hydrolase